MDAFVRLAVGAIDRLVADEPVRRELRRAMVSDGGDDDLGRLERAQLALTRVLCFEQATLAHRPLSHADLERTLCRGSLDAEGRLRTLYELSLAGGRSWGAVDSLRRSPPAQPDTWSTATDPVSRALRTVTLTSWTHRRASVREAADNARSSPLGFCRLVLEEADEAGAGEAPAACSPGSALVEACQLLDDPFLRREAPRPWFDLRARCAVYLADRSRRLGRAELLEAQIAALPELLRAGTGAAGLQALEQELLAARDADAGDLASARRRLLRANELLGDAAPDRRAEAQLKYARVLASDPSTLGLAEEALDTVARDLAAVPSETNPHLRLHLGLARARVQADLAGQAVAKVLPLAAADDIGSGSALPAYAEAWRVQSGRLAAIREELEKMQNLLRTAGTARQRAEHRWLLGLSWLVADRGCATAHLRSARQDFQALGDAAAADRVSADVIVCSVLAAAAGELLEDWSEPLRLFRQLAARTRSS